MAFESVDGGLDGVRGEFHEAPAFHTNPADADACDAAFPAKEPAGDQVTDYAHAWRRQFSRCGRPHPEVCGVPQ